MIEAREGLVQILLIVLIPLPRYGFDPTEAAVPWKALKTNNVKVAFATPDGRPASADLRLLTGKGLPPFVRLAAKIKPGPRAAYDEMILSREFQNPISYKKINPSRFDGLILPGGHDPAVKEYLESPRLRELVAYFFKHYLPIGAICHSTLIVARTRSEATGLPILWLRRTTGLTRNQEMTSYCVSRYWLGDYFRPYKATVQGELTRALKRPTQFDPGPGSPFPLRHDCESNLRNGFAVVDDNYVSARWPGDVYTFTNNFLRVLNRASTKERK